MTAPAIARTSVSRARQSDTHPLDLTAYLERIGLPHLGQVDGAVVRALHRHHVGAIPFENLDVLLGREVSLDPARIEEKLVHRHRGGYCYEHNTLLASVLEQLGFDVHRLVGRVNPTRPGPRTHMLLRVHDGNTEWLVDVGLGMDAQPAEPLPFNARGPVDVDGWRYRLARGSFPGARRLQVRRHDGWQSLYEFTEEPHHVVDYQLFNYNVSHSPDSPFVRALVVQTNGGAVRHRLTAEGLTAHHAPVGAAPPPKVVSPEQLGGVLLTFGLDLEPGDVERLSSFMGAPRK